MRFPPALLEDWMRRYYFETEVDIGSSGLGFDGASAQLERGLTHLSALLASGA